MKLYLYIACELPLGWLFIENYHYYSRKSQSKQFNYFGQLPSYILTIQVRGYNFEGGKGQFHEWKHPIPFSLTLLTKITNVTGSTERKLKQDKLSLSLYGTPVACTVPRPHGPSTRKSQTTQHRPRISNS